MAKTHRKLSLKKETLRQLDDNQLAEVGGGNEYLSRVVPPLTFTCGCDTVGCLNLDYNLYNYNIYYW